MESIHLHGGRAEDNQLSNHSLEAEPVFKDEKLNNCPFNIHYFSKFNYELFNSSKLHITVNRLRILTGSHQHNIT